MELQLFNYNGNNVSFRKEGDNVFVNATEMAKPFGETKRAKNWLTWFSWENMMSELISYLEE